MTVLVVDSPYFTMRSRSITHNKNNSVVIQTIVVIVHVIPAHSAVCTGYTIV